MKSENCHCENEAEVMYKMYKVLGTLRDADWTGDSSCCTDSEVHIVIAGKTLTITHADGTVFTYTDSDDVEINEDTPL